MNNFGWCVVYLVLLIASFGSEMSLYEDALKHLEEQENQADKKPVDPTDLNNKKPG